MGRFSYGMDASMSREDIVREVIRHRRSVRKFTERPIDPRDLAEIIEAGIYAPSGSNYQTQRFMVLTDRADIERVFQFKEQGKLKCHTAAAIILVFSDRDCQRRDSEEHIWDILPIQDCAASIQNMLLMATAKQIGSCWVSLGMRMSGKRPLKYRSMAEFLKPWDIPPRYEPQGMVALGYTKSLDELGYPKGYQKHGYINTSTARKPMPHYMIGNREFSPRTAIDDSATPE